jgi:alginate O-acetyltransferase complex protein AlgI
MLFNSNVFIFGFLPIVFTLFWTLRTRQQRWVLLTISGYVFYGWWNWKFCGLLALSSLVSFGAALMIARAPNRTVARRWVVASVGFDLAMLGFFKYYNFAASSLRAVLPSFAPPVLDIVLPIGISFYTFHTISYILDVADGRVRPTRRLFEYLAYVSLFSQLVAGPIIRFRQIEDDLEHVDREPQDAYFSHGIGIFVIGLLKKVAIADHLGALVDPMLARYATLSTLGAWLAALGYTFQLYYDFSGYSDMAIGLGYLFGLRIPRNFNAPYTATGIIDFWRRWHISLSSWLRDYLYIRLGGNRHGRMRTLRNLLVTMLLGGLWHGANWTFVVWGLYHGVLLALNRTFEPWLRRWPAIALRATTFLLVVVGWVVFRSADLRMAATWLRRMAGVGGGLERPPAALGWWVLICVALANLVPETVDLRLRVSRRWLVGYAAVFLVAYLFMNGRDTVFLYYQF